MNARKLPAPYKHQLSGPDVLGFYNWKHIQAADSYVYERMFSNETQLANFLTDRYGRRFAVKVIADNREFATIH